MGYQPNQHLKWLKAKSGGGEINELIDARGESEISAPSEYLRFYISLQTPGPPPNDDKYTLGKQTEPYDVTIDSGDSFRRTRSLQKEENEKLAR